MIARNQIDSIEDYENLPPAPEGFDKIVHIDFRGDEAVPRTIQYLSDPARVLDVLENIEATLFNVREILREKDEFKQKRANEWLENKEKRIAEREKRKQRQEKRKIEDLERERKIAAVHKHNEQIRKSVAIREIELERRNLLRYAKGKDIFSHLWMTNDIYVDSIAYVRDDIRNLRIGDLCPAISLRDCKVTSIEIHGFQVWVGFDLKIKPCFTIADWIIRRRRPEEMETA